MVEIREMERTQEDSGHGATHKSPVKTYRRVRRRRPTAASGDDSSRAYRPPADSGRPFAATAVAVPPQALAVFESNEFAYASLPAAVAAEEVEVVVEPVQATETAPVPEAEPEAAAGDEAPVREAEKAPETETVEAAPQEEVPQAAAVEEVKTEAQEPEAELPYKVSADDAAQISNELLTAAEASQEPERKEEKAPAPKVGPRVLGRIDLTKKAVPVRPAQPAAKPEKEKEKEKEAAKDETRGRKRKRKVVRKEDMFDAFERSYQVRPRKKRAAPGQKVRQTEVTTPKASKRIVKINEATTPGELARSMGVKAGQVMSALVRLGVMKSINDVLDLDTTTLVADEFEYTVENTAVDVDALLELNGAITDDTVDAEPRPPVVTVMGHVDHGKTSLLDVIRQTNVVASESGGITQHIGAYTVEMPQGKVCFLDTPGHAAFTAMRARGAGVTDIVILVVAADDGVMPQTIEAVNHAKEAELPVVVAVNKIDKPGATPDRIKQQLSEHGLQPEDWGGDTQFVEVSALEKTGIDTLLEAVLLQAEVLDLKAPAETRAQGTVIEARLDRGRGPVATVLVCEGKLERGDHFVCGEVVGRVRAMSDHAGRELKEAGPSTPVEIIGLDGVPSAGDSFVAVEDPSRAGQVADFRKDAARKQQLAASTRMSLEDLQRQLSSGDLSELKIVIKADVDGSVEAIRQALEKLSTPEVTLRVVHGAVGAVSESDVQLAMASEAIIVGFHVRPESKARTLAEREGVDVRLHSVIYELVDEVTEGLEGLLEPEYREVFEGRAEVRDTFSVPGGTIAGCYVNDGSFSRGHDCRLLRDNIVVHTSKVGSLRRFKDDVREVQSGYECGIGIERYNDLKIGDVIESFRIEAIKRTLEGSRAAASAEAAE